MDVLLTHGYFLDEDPHERAVMKPYPPLGILYISAYLKSRGFDVGVHDTTFSSLAALQDRIADERPPVVGIYGNLMTRTNVLKVIEAARQHGALVVLGGPEPASYPEEYLARGADVIVEGEGELPMEDILTTMAEAGRAGLGKVPGLILAAEDGRIVRTGSRPAVECLDDLPFPDRAAIDIPRYMSTWREHHGQTSVSLITARGCAFRCSWCSHGVYGYTHRRRSPENVADEVEHIVAAYDPDLLWYADDVFTVRHRWLFAYADELKRRGLRIPFETITREDRLNEGVVRTLAHMGCHRIWIGSESGSQEVLDRMSRHTDAARVREMVKLLQNHGIEAGLFIMFGYEGEDVAAIEETVAHVKAARPDVFVTTVAYPIKGTPYYDQVADRIIALRPWDQGSDRDLTVAGRHSRRFYGFATRWAVNEVALDKMQAQGAGGYRRRAKAFVNARVGRLGMRLTARQVERG